MQTDPLADFLTQIRNANAAGLTSVKTPSSNLKVNVTKVLKIEGYIEDFSVEKDGAKQSLTLKLKRSGREKAITGIRRISKPGLRKYVGSSDIPRVLGGLGVVILSTPRGVISGHEAKKQNIGGEVLAYIW